MENYNHQVEVDEDKRIISIYRLYPSGTKQLFTSVELPHKTFAQDEEGFRNFARTLGENLLVDSPAARKLLGLSDKS